MRLLHSLTFLFAVLLFSACGPRNASIEPPWPTYTPVPTFTSTPAGSDDAEAYHNRGVAHAELGRYAETITDLETAAELAQTAGDDDLAATIEEALEAVRNP